MAPYFAILPEFRVAINTASIEIELNLDCFHHCLISRLNPMDPSRQIPITYLGP